jgi:hypothetical protein
LTYKYIVSNYNIFCEILVYINMYKNIEQIYYIFHFPILIFKILNCCPLLKFFISCEIIINNNSQTCELTMLAKFMWLT